MRKIVLVLVGCLALAGCSGTWEAEIRLKVAKIDEDDAVPTYLPPRARVWLDRVGELQESAYDRDNFTGTVVEPAEIDGEVAVGDEVTCLAKQRSIGILQTNSIQTELFQCRKA
ncbi:hypothetical protein [Lentzea aerocolonigenes]|uniref:hypothetical protein n=1 Tax=Lentzea aerocolonigenes TaxID=68170 RepID=UPI0004C3BE89|nr:hypothetical protein [Lentzea aerocolonigenes]MCP2248546.1 hypothetical protein [Lentzea aerocolonigenes]